MSFTTATCNYDDLGPDSPFMRSTCRACSLRAMAQSPFFHHSQREGRITPDYERSLKACFGEGWKAAHEEIKTVAERIRDARTEVL